MTSRCVVVASDHAGFELKEAIKRHLTTQGVVVQDVGTSSTEACDYPVFARAAAESVASGRAWRGVVVDGAGIGSCMVANKVPGVRAAMAFDIATAKNAREHNDATVLTLGAGHLAEPLALRIVDTFLGAECTVDRHKRRVDLINAMDRDRAGARAPGPLDAASLVEQISSVLRSNPALLVGVQPGCDTRTDSACGVCTSCGHCASKQTSVVQGMLAATPSARLSSTLGVRNVPVDLAKLIDHTLLRADASYGEIDRLCDEALQYGFASVCVNPIHVPRCAARLKASRVAVCTVIGFPLGATSKQVKALEARQAIREGAREIDMVIAIGALKSGDHRTVYEDIRLVAEAARDGGALLKVIIETGALTDEEKVAACVLAKRARASFVKTSTGFGKGGATAHDVALMARAVGYELGVKASGGIKSADQARELVAAGATRIGASVGVKIAQEIRGVA